ncbi:hypothetical protein DFH06DRAFT_1123749 [Mycena polygramma]|nr:hypothetical protein DFH06DRAFT_1123749 [Mycena polygramma]
MSEVAELKFQQGPDSLVPLKSAAQNNRKDMGVEELHTDSRGSKMMCLNIEYCGNIETHLHGIAVVRAPGDPPDPNYRHTRSQKRLTRCRASLRAASGIRIPEVPETQFNSTPMLLSFVSQYMRTIARFRTTGSKNGRLELPVVVSIASIDCPTTGRRGFAALSLQTKARCAAGSREAECALGSRCSASRRKLFHSKFYSELPGLCFCHGKRSGYS